MKRLLLGLLTFLPACTAVDSPAPNDDETAEQTLAGDIDDWCDSTCDRLEACGEECECAGDSCECTGISDDCEDDCREALGSFIGYGDACAEIGRDMMDCVDELQTCAEFHSDYDCNPSRAEAVCGDDYDDYDDDDGDDGYNDSDDDEPPTSAPTPIGPNPVSCDAASGGGSAGSAGSGNVPAAFQCQSLQEACSDGARYQLVCNGTSELASCSCFRSGVFTGSFELAPARCPTTAETNVGCGWNLLY